MAGTLVNNFARTSNIFEGVVENLINKCFIFMWYTSWLRDESSKKLGTHSIINIRSFMICIALEIY